VLGIRNAGGKIVELGHLPAASLGDPTPGPQEDVVVPTELLHGLCHPDEVIGTVEITTEENDDRFDVAVEDRQSFGGVLGGERVVSRLAASDDLSAIGRQS
jgi:hypothetical protein